MRFKAFLLEELDYAGSHRPPGPHYGAPLYDLTGGGEVYPDDVYSPDGPRYYSHYGDSRDRAAFLVVWACHNKPNAIVTIYRAIPNQNVDRLTINKGDWVTTVKAYAKEHGESALDGKYRILSKKVRAKDVWGNGDSIFEYGYWGE